MIRGLTLLFASGTFGGFLEAVSFWFFGKIGINALMGMPAPGWNPAMIYRPVVWGGIWGLIFVIPFLGNKIVWRGIILSIAPTLAAWFVFIPARTPGFHGTLSMLSLIIILNAIWGIATGFWLNLARKS